MAIFAGASPSLVAYKFSISTTRSPRLIKVSVAQSSSRCPTRRGPRRSRAAYRRLALRWHPDTCSSKCGEESRRHAERFMAAREAYEVLSDPARRRTYDHDIAGGCWTAAFRNRCSRPRGGATAATTDGSNWETQLDGLRRRSAAAEAGGEGTWGSRVLRTRRRRPGELILGRWRLDSANLEIDSVSPNILEHESNDPQENLSNFPRIMEIFVLFISPKGDR